MTFRNNKNENITIDKAGNLFNGAKCINPLRDSEDQISRNFFHVIAMTPTPEITGFVEHRIDTNGVFQRLD